MTPRQPWPFPTKDHHPDPQAPRAAPAPAAPPPDGGANVQVRHVSEDTLDDAVSDTFPASDPVAVVATKVVPADAAPAPAPGGASPRDRET
ncbi:hypothetical protein [Acidovorax sp. FG27]|uniref:hypothetical protein n=1 Tax=Acidovorax sp. FG27 TaxID=3133652 RepID=UPI00334105B3